MSIIPLTGLLSVHGHAEGPQLLKQRRKLTYPIWKQVENARQRVMICILWVLMPVSYCNGTGWVEEMGDLGQYFQR